ncbi:MAG TPA: type VI secretion system tube protein Hcp [Solirubrobacteraceae bacterium]|nr:type VI secretion system tube protein Hcp [Solirubrobacteraceae bacterium]
MSAEEASRIAQAVQRMRNSKRALQIALPTTAALGAGAAVAVGSIPGGDGTIMGCYAGPSGLTINGVAGGPIATEPAGTLRVIDPSKSTLPNATPDEYQCRAKEESTITWSQQGPPGLQGVTGPQGPAGGQGANGAPGAPLIGDTSFGISGNGHTFLKIEGIKGESTDKWHKDQILVDSFSLGTHAQGASGGGGGAGKVSIQSFTITKTIDKASPLLFKGEAGGTSYKEMVLSFARKAGGTQHDYLKFTFENVLISSITDGTSHKLVPEEQVTFTFQKCKETFVPIDSSGKAGSPVSVLISGNNAKI